MLIVIQMESTKPLRIGDQSANGKRFGKKCCHNRAANVMNTEFTTLRTRSSHCLLKFPLAPANNALTSSFTRTDTSSSFSTYHLSQRHRVKDAMTPHIPRWIAQHYHGMHYPISPLYVRAPKRKE